MAVTISNVLNGGGVPSGTTNTTASWTPDGTSQALLTVSAYVSTGSVVPVIGSVTGNGLTWTALKNVSGDNTGADRTVQYMFAAPAGGSAGAITVTWSTATPSRASWVLDKVAGADSTLGAGTLVQPAVTGASSGANPSATLANALATGSVSYASACFESSAGTLSAGSGYTALGQNTSQSLAWTISEWNSAGSTTASAANSTVTNRHSIILIEVPRAIPGPQVADVQESSWITTTTPKTLTFAGAQAGDRILVLGGGDASVQFGSNEVTACATTTTSGTTGSWTEPAEGLSSGDFDWISSATTTVSSTGSVTVQMDRTKNGTTGGTWGFYGLLIRGDGGIGNVAGVTAAGSSQTVSLTTSQDSLVAFISTDWDAAAFATGLTPSGGTDVERSSGADYTVCAGYWRGQSAATTSYGGSGGGASSKYRCLAIEVLTLGSGNTGTAAVTEASDTASASGTLGYSGTTAATETNDTAAASGTVVNQVTGTISATQANNTSTASGTVTAPGVSGAAAVTQQNNSASASGLLGYAGTAAASQAGNTATASGTNTPPGSSGSVAAVQANQTSSASGVLGYTGSAAASQANQTATASGQLGYSGSATSSQAGQISTASGTFTAGGSFSGSAAATQANQTASASGQLGYSGTAAATQAGNTPSATGTVINPVTGTASAAQANQISTASGVLRYTGTATAIEAADMSTASGTVAGPVTGLAVVTQASQTAAASGTFMPLVLFGTATGAIGSAPKSSGATQPVAAAYAATGTTAAASSGSMNVPTATGG